MAWEMFQRSVEFSQHQALAKEAAAKPTIPKKGLFSEKRLNAFELSMKRQFGLTPEKAADLVQVGQAYLAALQNIDHEARTEAMHRYGRPAPSSERSKTVHERAKEDGLYAEVEQKKQAALASYLQKLSSKFQPTDVAKMGQWVRTSVAPQITITHDAIKPPVFSNRRQPNQSNSEAK